MAENSKIEWCDTTWNPLAGCTWASPGCDHCYAAVMARRLEYMALADIEAGRDPGRKRKYIGTTNKNSAGRIMFNGVVNLDPDALAEPLSWTKPRKVFVNSMSDLFHKAVPDAFVLSVVEVMRSTPQHTYQVLTKRPERMAAFTEKLGAFPDNVIAMTSVENQAAADARIPYLLQVKARLRGLSCEPLLGPVDLGLMTAAYHRWRTTCEANYKRGIHWVIVGGESGHGARPMHPAWARSLRDQCQAAGVAYFFKQWGEYTPYYEQADPDSGQLRLAEFAKGMRRVGKARAGRLLDGREWNEVPV